MNSTDARRRLAILLAAALAVLGYMIIWTRFKPVVFANTHSDFSCFYRAGRMVIEGDASRVYDLAAERQFDRRLGTNFVDGKGESFSLPFVFPPYSLAVFAPLACLPLRTAELAWYVINIGMLLALPFALRWRRQWKDQTIAAELLAPLLFLPAVLALMQGQPSILLLLLLALVFAALSQGQDARAGMALAFVTLKPQLVLPMLLALVVWRKWKALAAFAWTSIALLGVSVAVVGQSAVLDYPGALMRFNHLAGSLGGEHPESMPNLRGGLYLLLQDRCSGKAVAGITMALSVFLLVALAMLLKRHVTPSPAAYSLTIVVTLVVSYHAYLHDDALLLLPMILAAQHVFRNRLTVTRMALMAAIAGLYIIPLLPASLSTTAIEMLVVMVVFSALLAVELRSEAKSHQTKAAEPQLARVPHSGLHLARVGLALERTAPPQ